MAGDNTFFREEILALFGYSLGSMPIKHLGVPLISTSLSSVDCRRLIDKILARIQSWTTRFLSFAGRLQLILSVLYSLQNYWAGLFIFTRKVINEIEKLIRRFLWSGPDLKVHGSKVAWEDIATPKEEGGLGLRKLEDINFSLMAHHIWLICLPCTSSPWVNWVRRYLIREHSFWDLPIPSSCSWTWRKLLGMRDKIRPFLKVKIGDGADTWLWLDSWLPMGPILQNFDDRIIYDSGLPRHARVSSIIRNGQWAWPVENSPDLLILKQAIPPSLQPSCDKRDRLIWTPSASGSFSTMSA